jgi:import inner membrane translocase subunit TIM50
VIVDKNPKMVKLHPENAILLPEFQGTENDRALIELLPFLEHLVKDKIPDVRKEIEKYGHVETGKKYLERLEKIRDGLLKQQQSGFNRFLTKRPNTSQETEPLTGSTPKPPVN